jgi:hypothetical protein
MDTAAILDRSRFDTALATTRRQYNLLIDGDWREAADGGVLTRVSLAHDILVSTYVWINTFMDGAAELAFGGFKQSGLGRELGRNAVADYTEEKTLHLHAGPQTNWCCRRTRTELREYSSSLRRTDLSKRRK